MYDSSRGTYCSTNYVQPCKNGKRNETGCRNTGFKENVKGFYIYRSLMYCEDVTARSPMFQQGSVGGCCLIPIGLYPRRCHSNSCVRTVSLTPNGTSTYYILDFIINDLLRAAHYGISAIDCHGERCVGYIYVAGFVGDYPASSTAIYCMSHAANAPCAHCSSRVLHVTDLKSKSEYAHTWSINSGNSSSSRGFEKTIALPKQDIADEDCNNIGMNNGQFQVLLLPWR